MSCADAVKDSVKPSKTAKNCPNKHRLFFCHQDSILMAKWVCRACGTPAASRGTRRVLYQDIFYTVYQGILYACLVRVS